LIYFFLFYTQRKRALVALSRQVACYPNNYDICRFATTTTPMGKDHLKMVSHGHLSSTGGKLVN
jgi:hypothetical protein